jgi:uncharacterized protein
MQGKYIPRRYHPLVREYLDEFPAVAIVGPRQCGKTTLAKAVLTAFGNAVYLDLEKPSDINKLRDPELFFRFNDAGLTCLDEIQRVPDIFPVLRSVLDEGGKNGQLLILGSASPAMIRQTSESLAGRIAYLELTPFLFSESPGERSPLAFDINRYWLRGGFPRSYLARSDRASSRWREQFIRTFLERDIPQLGYRIAAESLRRLWMMLSHYHGQLLNLSKLGESLGVSHTTVRAHLDILAQAFMVRVLPPFEVNLKKRLVKSPKIFIRDPGILHSLLDIETFQNLIGHPVFGSSWEGVVVENILSLFDGWKSGFYRTSAGAELDIVLEKGGRRIGVECKASAAPYVSKGFWNAFDDLELEEAWVIAPVEKSYPIETNVTVCSLDEFLKRKQR